MSLWSLYVHGPTLGFGDAPDLYDAVFITCDVFFTVVAFFAIKLVAGLGCLDPAADADATDAATPVATDCTCWLVMM